MIKEYRKKPVKITALKFDGENFNECVDFIGGAAIYEKKSGSSSDELVGREVKERLSIKTLEGAMHLSNGDYIIKGVKGEFYPCKPNIFRETYNEA
jgi:hypothetical protein